ncbi:MAG TPA: sulfurtransferase TusA family protein [Candidatus Avisuccinivibrio pullicola]|nr:sulfurtransferase TusA family protein [Candidatus Avisuccinivibrio pullicola]
MLLRAAVRRSEPGTLIELYSEDPVSLRDVPAYCEFIGHELVSLPDAEHPHRFVIKTKAVS